MINGCEVKFPSERDIKQIFEKESTMTLKVGDVVVLKSGGRAMTVVQRDEQDANYNIACMMQGRDGSVRRIWFPEAALEKYTPAKKIEEVNPTRPDVCTD